MITSVLLESVQKSPPNSDLGLIGRSYVSVSSDFKASNKLHEQIFTFLNS